MHPGSFHQPLWSVWLFLQCHGTIIKLCLQQKTELWPHLQSFSWKETDSLTNLVPKDSSQSPKIELFAWVLQLYKKGWQRCHWAGSVWSLRQVQVSWHPQECPGLSWSSWHPTEITAELTRWPGQTHWNEPLTFLNIKAKMGLSSPWPLSALHYKAFLNPQSNFSCLCFLFGNWSLFFTWVESRNFRKTTGSRTEMSRYLLKGWDSRRQQNNEVWGWSKGWTSNSKQKQAEGRRRWPWGRSNLTLTSIKVERNGEGGQSHCVLGWKFWSWYQGSHGLYLRIHYI